MKKYFFLSLFSFAAASIFGQASGYLGNKNHVQVTLMAAPSLKSTGRIDGNIHNLHAKICNVSYSFAYSRIFSKDFEVAVGYQFSKMQGVTDLVDVNSQRLLETPALTYHGGFISFNFYRKGSHSPIGKYRGFVFGYGVSGFESNQQAIIGSLSDNVSSNFFSTKYNIESTSNVDIPQVNVTHSYLKMRIGRSYPINDFLLFHGGFSFPLLTYFTSSEGTSGFGFNVNDFIGRDIEEDRDWGRYAQATTYIYNGITLEAGLRLTF